MISQGVTQINEVLQASNITNDRFANRAVFGVAYPQLRKSSTGKFDQVPFFIEGKKFREIVLTDKNVITMWHRILSTTVTVNPRNQYGDGQYLTRTAQMVLICVADVQRLEMSPEGLELLIADAFPLKLTKALEQTLKLQGSSIQHLGANYNSADIYLREFKAEEYMLKPQHTMFEVQYKIECTFKQGCINTCDECLTN